MDATVFNKNDSVTEPLNEFQNYGDQDQQGKTSTSYFDRRKIKSRGSLSKIKDSYQSKRRLTNSSMMKSHDFNQPAK